MLNRDKSDLEQLLCGKRTRVLILRHEAAGIVNLRFLTVQSLMKLLMIQQILFVCLCFCQYLPDYFRATIYLQYHFLLWNSWKIFPTSYLFKTWTTLECTPEKEVEFVSRQPLKVLHATFFFRCVTARNIDWQSRLLAWYNFTISLSGRNLESVNLFKLFSAESCIDIKLN